MHACHAAAIFSPDVQLWPWLVASYRTNASLKVWRQIFSTTYPMKSLEWYTRSMSISLTEYRQGTSANSEISIGLQKHSNFWPICKCNLEKWHTYLKLTKWTYVGKLTCKKMYRIGTLGRSREALNKYKDRVDGYLVKQRKWTKENLFTSTRWTNGLKLRTQNYKINWKIYNKWLIREI